MTTTEPVTTSPSLVARLRGEARHDGFVSPNLGDCLEAADVIESQRELLAEVLSCIDEDDYVALTMLFPHLSASQGREQ